MGISIPSSLIVGLPFCRLEEFIDNNTEEGEDCIDTLHKFFEFASPHYYSKMEDWFVGFEVDAYATDVGFVTQQLDILSRKFKDLTGQDPLVYCAPNIV